MSTTATSSHRWSYFRAGGFDQIRFQSGADLVNLPHLDQKLWAALSCPTRGVEFDTKTLDLLDTDKDGRVRAPEVLAAVKWTCSMLKNPDHILRGSVSLELDAINEATPEGQQLLASARQILINLGKKDAAAITIEDTTDTARIFSTTQFNGDGIVPAESAADDATRAIINDIVACMGSELDRSGKPGISRPKADAFFAEAQAFSDWWKMAESDAAVLPLGERTAEGLAALNAVRAKVDDYFGRCRLAAFDQRALLAVNRQEADYLALTARDLTISASEISTFPLARVEAHRALPLKDGVNPAWAGAIAAFQVCVVKPLLGAEKAALTEEDWSTILGNLGAYEAWAGAKAGSAVEILGLARVREILAGKAQETISSLIAKDKALEPEAASIAAVEKLVRFHRDLKQLLMNFVSFEDFYSHRRKAIFQAGTLYLDGRSCELCVPVADAAKHALLAGLAKSYLAYCDCTRPGGEKMTIAAAFTDGDADYLMAGRNGLFYDRKGRDWDATITKVIENPISIRQAFWAPYKKLVRLVEEQVAKRAAAAESAADGRLASATTATANADKAKAEQKKIDVGTVAALGVAFGAIGTAFAALAGYVAGVLKLPFWQVCLAFVGLFLIISGPAMLIAWLKLRQRNLGPILDANGWAINGRVKMNVPFGGSLTKVASLPAGAQPSFAVRYPEAPTALPKLLFTLIVICFLYSLLNHFGLIAKATGGVLGKNPAAAAQTKTNAVESASTNVPPPAAPAPAAK
ncbi:MAG TPA: hypothetical protein VNU68_26270 [Verrucomicrobiae bacterium]|nr:hypothetical protein [Verrucomicrobiae bacterium]